MPFTAKIHGKDTSREIIAACDNEILGKILIDRKKEVEFKVSKEFYGSECFEWEEIADSISNGRNVNLVGNNIVELAIKSGLIDPKSVIEIDGVKHAQIYSL
ncbi:DUF424 family protein [Candidatus Parvarchaeota archaeon]|jgi:hypothetical protein|nr:DUF424 family protein [Candidatus Parvarchaeota archaeon]